MSEPSVGEPGAEPIGPLPAPAHPGPASSGSEPTIPSTDSQEDAASPGPGENGFAPGNREADRTGHGEDGYHAATGTDHGEEDGDGPPRPSRSRTAPAPAEAPSDYGAGAGCGDRSARGRACRGVCGCGGFRVGCPGGRCGDRRAPASTTSSPYRRHPSFSTPSGTAHPCGRGGPSLARPPGTCPGDRCNGGDSRPVSDSRCQDGTYVPQERA